MINVFTVIQSSSRCLPRSALAVLAASLVLTSQSQAADEVLPGSALPISSPQATPLGLPSFPGTGLGRFNRRNAPSNFPDFATPESAPVRPLLVYFPPQVPRLDAHIALPNLTESGWPAPAELAAYVNEPFYAPLGSRIAEKTLSKKQRQRVETYLAAKLRLQNELRARLAALRNADSATRQREFTALAQQENPQIDKLEREAEQLRVDLIRGEFFQSSVDWNESREWRLGTTRFRTAVEAIGAQFLVMRSAAFYQKGFLPFQRQLLTEVAMELGEIPVTAAEASEPVPDVAPPPTDTNPLLYFSPLTSRVRLPADLPLELADKISAYEREKSNLKKDLRDLVYNEDKTYYAFMRTHAAQS